MDVVVTVIVDKDDVTEVETELPEVMVEVIGHVVTVV
jgi:hypothetical protein